MTAATTDRPVLIAIPTFRRTALLGPLIAAVRTDAEASGSPFRILLVDNDPERSAEAPAAAHGVPYLPEPAPGIAAVRQAALDAAREDELTVMIDDDLLPEQGWLAGLVSVWRDTAATVVMGYVRYVWPEGTDPWIAAGGFMRRTRFASGSALDFLATGNVLVDTAQVRRIGARFDVSLGLIGGEDTVFGRAVLARGGTIVAAGGSVARDDIPAERTTRSFVRRRTISHGQARVRLLVREAPRPAQPLRRLVECAGGIIRLLVFSAGIAAARIRGDVARSAVMQRRAWFAQGRILGALGRVTPEYARP